MVVAESATSLKYHKLCQTSISQEQRQFSLVSSVQPANVTRRWERWWRHAFDGRHESREIRFNSGSNNRAENKGRHSGKGSIASRSQTIGSYGEGRGEITIRGQLNFPATSWYEKLFVSSNLFRLATNGKTSTELCKCTARNSFAKYQARTTRSRVLSLSNFSLPFSTRPSSITGVSYIPVRA